MRALFLAMAGSVAAASSQPPPSEPAIPDPPALREGPDLPSLPAAAGLGVAERLVQEGRPEAAAPILEALLDAPAGIIDGVKVRFLLGLVAVARGDYKAAEALFRAILDERPDLVRVRLELARALFAMKKDEAAAYHFRFALAGDLPPETIENIRLFLALIEKRKSWRISASLAIAPDSNVNAGPEDPTITLFGLPFELDEDARRTSGIGLSSTLSAEAYPRLRGPLRLEVRASAAFTDYQNKQFDDLFVAAEAGPQLQLGDLRASALATASRRVFGGEGYSRSLGGRLAFTKGVTSRMDVTLRLSGAFTRYDEARLRDGPVYAAALGLHRALDRRSAARVTISATREETHEPVLRNTLYQAGASYIREFPLGLTAEFGPDLYYRPFDRYDSSIGATRRDWTYGGSISVIKRDWRVYGFAPVASYRYLRNDSNGDRFRYDRHRVSVGLTRSF
ncbi:MAG: surface lipoprotein assembly modifier [Amphiplicatus sp.]